MAVISFTGNFNDELLEVQFLKNSVDNGIRNIKTVFDELPSIWNDSKSASFISSQQTLLTDLMTANEKAKTSADEYLTTINNILNQMYEN